MTPNTHRHVIVDRRHLPWAPDEGDDRERPAGLRVQEVAAVPIRLADPLLGIEHVRGR
jgi:hypothetical protein